MTVEFQGTGDGGTTVVLTHTGFPDDRSRDLHGDGWSGCLANLESRVLRAGAAR